MTPLIRPATEADLPRILALEPCDGTRFLDAERLRGDLALGTVRPSWIWIAEDGDGDGGGGDRLLARAVWWAPVDAPVPVALDEVWVSPRVDDPAELTAALLERAHAAFAELGAGGSGAHGLADFDIETSADAAQDAALAAAVAWRERVADRVGLTRRVERVKLLWEQGDPVPGASERLDFRAATDEDFVAAFQLVAQGSLDWTTQQDIAAVGPEQQARDEIDFYRGLPGRRDDWRLAFERNAGTGGASGTSGMDLVGLIIPSRSAYSASVSYLGVVPGMRGRGYGLDLLNEITRIHAQRGEPTITALTDADNTPMRAAFAAGGYREVGVRIVRSAPRD